MAVLTCRNRPASTPLVSTPGCEDHAGFSTFQRAAEYYSKLYYARADRAFYTSLATTYGGPVLELGCGAGRILCDIAAAGIPVVGVDASAYMLEICRSRLSASSAIRAKLYLGDIRTFSLGQTFRLITIPYRPFQQLLTTADQLQCLESIHTHLDAHGVIAFDVFETRLEGLKDSLPGSYKVDPTVQMDDMNFVTRRYRKVACDRSAQTLDIAAEFVESKSCDNAFESTRADNIRWGYVYKLRYFFAWQLVRLLHLSGFELISISSDYRGTPLSIRRGKELVVTARKAT